MGVFYPPLFIRAKNRLGHRFFSLYFRNKKLTLYGQLLFWLASFHQKIRTTAVSG